MIGYYYAMSKDNNALIDMLLKEIESSNIKSLNDWDRCYYFGIDGILVNIVYNIINEKRLYDKEEIDTEFDKLLKPIYNKTSKLSHKQFYDIFDNIWYCKFEVVKNERKSIRDIANQNQPLIKRVVNTDKFILFYALFLLCLSGLIGGVLSFIATGILLTTVHTAVWQYGLTKGYAVAFVLLCSFSFVSSFIVAPYKSIELNECLAISFILQLTFIPILKINLPRMKDETRYKNKIERQKFY